MRAGRRGARTRGNVRAVALLGRRRSGGRKPVVPASLEHVVDGVTDGDANAANSSTHDGVGGRFDEPVWRMRDH